MPTDATVLLLHLNLIKKSSRWHVLLRYTIWYLFISTGAYFLGHPVHWQHRTYKIGPNSCIFRIMDVLCGRWNNDWPVLWTEVRCDRKTKTNWAKIAHHTHKHSKSRRNSITTDDTSGSIKSIGDGKMVSRLPK